MSTGDCDAVNRFHSFVIACRSKVVSRRPLSSRGFSNYLVGRANAS